jgi:very-short-patch-repair endonuclease
MRQKSATRGDPAVARIAGGQHGVVSLSQLAASGIGTSAIARRVRSGRLHRIHRGVYAVGHRHLDADGRWLAAVLACGPGAALTHRSAAALWGIRPQSSGAVEVTVPGHSGRRRRHGLVVHRSKTLVPADVIRRRGISVTRPERTVLDLRRVLAADQFDAALHRAEALRLDVGRQLGFEFDRSRSELERILIRLCRRHRLPAPETNVRVGRFEVDFLWRDGALIVETDGFRHHGTRRAFERDRARDARLAVLGYRVVRVTHRQLTVDPESAAATLRALLVARAGAPLG